MKTVITLIFAFFTIPLLAQTPACTVLLDSLKGTYEGGCKSGKADGEGKSIGIHSYKGSFKNGLPDGTGTYTWQNGDVYTGAWKKGRKDGRGEYHVKRNDSTITGFWKNDKYTGEYEKAYEVLNTNNYILHQKFTKLSSKEAIVTVSLVTGEYGNLRVKDFQVLSGSYVSVRFPALQQGSSVEFQGVRFPLKLRFGTNEAIEFVINESGEWLVELKP